MTISIPKGFRYAGVGCGIKTKSETKDVSLIVSDTPAVGVGVYTQNQVVAAPVVNCRAKTPGSEVRAIIVNSGNANACTGVQGENDAASMCMLTAELGGFSPEQTLVMSTGIIGHFLPMPKVEEGIRQCVRRLAESESGFLDAADGILTTDKGRKIASRSFAVDGNEITLSGMAKGAGMIGPNMATMLCCVLTDAKLSVEQADRLLKSAADVSFNNVSVEGHTSTNDTMILLANGQAGDEELTSSNEAVFAEHLNAICIELAKQIPADGEGASHLIEVTVTGADSDADARTLSHAIASSNLVKTAVAGNDPNWGRIVSAAGYAGPRIDMTTLRLNLNGTTLFDHGEPVSFDEKSASESIRDESTVVIELRVGNGSGSCTHWTSDLTVDYVRFNSEYTT